MIKRCLVMLVFIVNMCAANHDGHIVETDSTTYIKIDSSVEPTVNTSYGSILILDEIFIKFNLIYHDEPSTTSDKLENIFSIQSTTHSNDMNNNNNNNDMHCTEYPSMWFSPKHNSLYFSLLNQYCLTPFHPIRADIAYAIDIHYNISHVYVAINGIIIINEQHLAINTHDTINTIKLWISDSLSNAARVTLYNISIETVIIISHLKSQYSLSGNAKHKDAIYIIEIAVLTVFCFACLGVIIASLCLLKMRQTSVQIKMIQGKCENKFVMSSRSEPEADTIEISSLKRYTFDGDIDDIQLQEDEEEEEELKTDSNANSNSYSFITNVTSQGRYYVQAISEALRTARSKSVNTPKYHSNMNKSQIPTYYSARNIFTSQHTQKHKNKKNNVIVPQSTIPPTYYSANSIFTSQHTHNKKPNDLHLVNDIDAYDLNSDEGDEIKLRRAQIQSQRAVVSAFNLEMPLASTTNQTLLIAESDDEDLPEQEEEHTMDGLPATHGTHRITNDRSHCSSSSIEDMFHSHSDVTTPDQEDEMDDISTPRLESIATPTIPPTFFNSDAQTTAPPTLPTTFFNIEHQSTVPPTLPTTFFNIDRQSTVVTIPPTLPTTFFNIEHPSTIPPPFMHIDAQSTIPPTFVMQEAQSTVTVGPSIPSLATQVTVENEENENEVDNNDTSTDINNYSTVTNTTYLTSATKRYQLDARSGDGCDGNTYGFSSSEDANQLSSGDESTCITVPNTKRKSDTVSALSMVNSLRQNISVNYRRREYSSTAGNIQLSKSITLSEHDPLFDVQKRRNKSEIVVVDAMDNGNGLSSASSVIMGKIKRIKRVLSIGKSDDTAMTPSDSETVSYQNNTGSLNSMDDNCTLKLFPTFVMSDKIKHRKVASVQTKNTVSDSLSYFNDTKCAETSDEDSEVYDDSEVSYEWIKSALQNCDEDGWDKYYKNFKKHKVGDRRLTKLGDGDWRELLPEIGVRNDFKELWIVKQLNDDISHI